MELSGAKSTDYKNLESAQELSDKCVETSEKWKPVAERLWKESRSQELAALELISPCAGCRRCSQQK